MRYDHHLQCDQELKQIISMHYSREWRKDHISTVTHNLMLMHISHFVAFGNTKHRTSFDDCSVVVGFKIFTKSSSTTIVKC